MSFGQFKTIILVGAVGLVVTLCGVVYTATASTIEHATTDIVDLKVVAAELRTMVRELKDANERQDRQWSDHLEQHTSVVDARPRR